MEAYTVKPSGCSKVLGYLFMVFLAACVVVGLYAWSNTSNAYRAALSIPATRIVATPTPSLADIKTWATNVTYDSLARNTESYIGKSVHLHGEVVQVDERASDSYLLRLFVDNGDAVLVHYQGRRVLVNDKVDLYAHVDGRITYTTILGASLTVPELTAQILTIEK